MSTTRTIRSSYAARFLAAAALVFVLGAQLLEAAHFHSINEPVSSCVQCHSATGAALPANIPGFPVIAAAAVLLFLLHTPANRAPFFLAVLPRGPPRKS